MCSVKFHKSQKALLNLTNHRLGNATPRNVLSYNVCDWSENRDSLYTVLNSILKRVTTFWFKNGLSIRSFIPESYREINKLGFIKIKIHL